MRGEERRGEEMRGEERRGEERSGEERRGEVIGGEGQRQERDVAQSATPAAFGGSLTEDSINLYCCPNTHRTLWPLN